MAKLSLINRQRKREQLVERYSAKRKQLTDVATSAKFSDEERMQARHALQELPRNASPTRLRNRCAYSGRPRGNFRKFGLSRLRLREMAMRGEIPGLLKASW